MAHAKLIRPNSNVSVGLSRKTAVEIWRAYELTGWSHPANTASYVFPLCGPAMGADHPDSAMAGAVVVDKRLVQILSPTMADVAVIYDSASRWGGAHRGGMASDSTSQTLRYPAYWQPVPSESIWRPSLNPPVVERSIIVRTDEVYLTGDEDAIITQIASNCGRRYTRGGLLFFLESAGVAKARSGQIRIVYRFKTKAPVPGIAAGQPGVDVPIPALSYLDEWNPPDGPLTSPVIPVRTATVAYPAGDNLPGLA